MTIITFPLSESRQANPHLRRFNVRTDLRRVADLVEMCFADTLDLDGRRYIQQMRRTSEHARFLSWASGVASRASFPFSGFIWEQDGAIVGNLSLIPMNAHKKKIFLIANVATHPDHRRRGIAKKLTHAALEDCRIRGADEVWLHVREDNPGARELYTDLGFVEHGRRSSWSRSRLELKTPVLDDLQVEPLRARHHARFMHWMRRLHPEQLDWYLSLNLNVFRPGLLGDIIRFLNNAVIRQWVVNRGEELLGTVSWQRTHASMDRLWLAVPEQLDTDAVTALLNYAVRELSTSKKLHLEFPAGLAAGALEAAGFSHNHTLVWMQYGGLHGRHGKSK